MYPKEAFVSKTTCYVFYSLVVAVTIAIPEADIDNYLDRCIKSKYHKEKPGKEARFFHCSPWKNHACCTTNTTQNIQADGTISLYKMQWDQCNQQMSQKCRKFFEIDTCFYECSPNMAPWIVVDKRSKKTRRERFVGVPLCASDCDEWFDACKDDLTCSNNWGNYKTWNWTTGMCKMKCKSFKEYFGGPENFCNTLFNYSFKYTKGTPGEDCLLLWPDGSRSDANTRVARKAAETVLATMSKACILNINNVVSIFTLVVWFAVTSK